MQNQSKEEQENKKTTSTEEIITTPSYSQLFQLVNLPQEVFIEICENLHPKDLFSLTLVCKQFRTILWSDSTATQQLWYKSRLKFIPRCSYLKPPGDLSEQKFVWLLMGETCQYCGGKSEKDHKPLWEFKVLICSKCVQDRTISLKKLKESHASNPFPEKVLSCLPCISETILKNSFNYLINVTSPGYYGTNPYYWEADVFRTVDEYNSLPENKREDWINEKQVELKKYIGVIETMRAKENNLLFENVCRSLLSKSG